MAGRFESVSHRGFLLTLILVAACTAIFVLPFQKETRAAKGLFRKTESHEQNLPNYDIRSDKAAIEALAGFRTRLNKNAVQVADVRDTMVRGEQLLKQRVPNLKVEYNSDLRIPEVVAPDVKLGKKFLTRASRGKRSGILKTFLGQNSELIGANGAQIDDLKVAADYTNPDGNLSFVELHQEVNGIPVFRGEIKAGFTRAGEMIRVINNFAPGLDVYSLSTDFGDPLDAVKAAAANINNDGSKLDFAPNKKASTDLKAVFGGGDSATTAEKIYFPTEPGVAVPAWRVLIWQPVNAYYVIVDAQTGTVLWRKNITEDQTQSATYSVYTNSNAVINVAHSPFPFSPGPTSPNGVQGTAIARTPITRIGNEAPYTFNQLGWIPDGVTVTDGNAVQAGLDRDITDGIDPNSEAVSATRDFTFAYNPMNPNTNSGDAPIPPTQTYPGSAFQQGMITQLFYMCNWYHDETYRLGFTEAAGNFQDVNFTGKGMGGDRVRAEGQDSSGTNNANFSTAADGVRGRMQMFIFDGPNPRIDGGLDGDVVIHEHTHGLSNRLHGNSSGLFNDMSRGMGEGWSDFYGLSLLSQASDPLDGVYAASSYATYRFGGSFVNNSYYGIRRFPYAIKSSTGGPGNLPFNPLTFADIDQTQMNLTDGAYPRGLVGGSNGDEVHNAGEIWCSALWEIRARMIARLGWSVGNRQAM
ncbi:MAG: M36 family metallopeptidase, partial [Acidobacteriota bacterium]